MAPLIWLAAMAGFAAPSPSLAQSTEADIREKARHQFADPTGVSGTNTPGVQLVLDASEDGTQATASATFGAGALFGTLQIKAPFENRTDTSFATLEGIPADATAGLNLRWTWDDDHDSQGLRFEKACAQMNQVSARKALELARDPATGLLGSAERFRFEIPPADASAGRQKAFIEKVQKELLLDPGGDSPPPPQGSEVLEISRLVVRKACDAWSAAHPDRILVERIRRPKASGKPAGPGDADLVSAILAGRVVVPCGEEHWLDAEALEGAAKAAEGDGEDSNRVALAEDIRSLFEGLATRSSPLEKKIEAQTLAKHLQSLDTEVLKGLEKARKDAKEKHQKELFLEYRKRLEVLNRIPGGFALDGQNCDSGDILRVLGEAPRGPGRTRLFRNLRDGLLSENAFLIGAEVGTKDFEWIDSLPGELPFGGELSKKEASKLSSSYSAAYSRLSKGFTWEVRYSLKAKYKGADAVKICVPIANSSSFTCVDAAQSAPKRAETNVVGASLKRFETPELAWKAQLLYDVDNKVWNPHVQLYFLPQKKDGKLRGGLDLGYLINDPKQGDQFLPRLFFGAALDEWLPGS